MSEAHEAATGRQFERRSTLVRPEPADTRPPQVRPEPAETRPGATRNGGRAEAGVRPARPGLRSTGRMIGMRHPMTADLVLATDLVMAGAGVVGSQLGPDRPGPADRLRGYGTGDDARWAAAASLTRRPVPVAVASAVVTAAIVRALLGWRYRR